MITSVIFKLITFVVIVWVSIQTGTGKGNEEAGVNRLVRPPMGLSILEAALFYTSLPALCIYVQLGKSLPQTEIGMAAYVALTVVVAQWVMAWWLMDAKLVKVRQLLLLAGSLPLLLALLAVLLDMAMRTPANYFALGYLTLLGGIAPVYLHKSRAVRRFEQATMEE